MRYTDELLIMGPSARRPTPCARRRSRLAVPRALAGTTTHHHHPACAVQHASSIHQPRSKHNARHPALSRAGRYTGTVMNWATPSSTAGASGTPGDDRLMTRTSRYALL